MTFFKQTFSFDDCSLVDEWATPNPAELYESLSQLTNFSHVDISVGSRSISVWFSAEIEEVVEDKLRDLLQAHDGLVRIKHHYRIYEVTNIEPERWHDFPAALNYRTGLTTSLYPKRLFIKGEVTKVIWYMDEALTIPVIDIDIVYVRNEGGLAVTRETQRRWYLSDGTIAPEAKTTRKRYDVDMRLQITEVRQRRQNVYYSIEAKTVAFMLNTLNGATPTDRLLLGRLFLGRHKEALENYVNAGLRDALEDIQADDAAFLSEVTNDPIPGATIRDMILAELDIWS